MDELELFTISVFQKPDKRFENDDDHPAETSPRNENENDAVELIEEFQNMNSARVIKGRTLELEHSNLAGPGVKFKTVINYERTLKPNSWIGITFRSQDGYITRDGV